MKQLWQLYCDAVMPLEKRSFFEHFHTPPVTIQEFEGRPQVLLLGQYSTGKTSMVKWLSGSNSTHFDIKPQPSTDKFMAVVHGKEERIIHGHAATCLPQLPYQGLSVFGNNFLSSFQAVALPSEILQDITLIDTPGVLAGNKQNIGRDYHFASICEWMADRADLVLLTFDAHKLDISDEFQEVMQVLRPFADKVRCVLNKADQIDATNLVRVYGALLWNVGKVLQTPEVARVFVSSFWDESYRYQDHQQLFEEDKEAVMKELRDLPRNSLLRKINAFVARVRRVRAHLAVMTHIKSQLPRLIWAMGAEVRMRRFVIDHLPQLWADAQRLRGLSSGDMPSLEDFRRKLDSFNGLAQLPAWDAKDFDRLDRIISVDVPALISRVGGVSTPHSFTEPGSRSSTSVWSPSGWGICRGKRKRTDD